MLYPQFDELVSYKDLKIKGEIAPSLPSHAQNFGNQYSPFRGRGLEFDSVREYVLGDDIRHLDWKVTARTGSPHLKIFQEERQRHVVLCIDMNTHMRFGTRKTFKSIQAARVAALLGWQAIARQDKISGCLFGDITGGIEFFTSKHNKIAFSHLLKKLSQASTETHETPIVEAYRQVGHIASSGSLIYFISDFMDSREDKEQLALLSRLNRNCDIVFISVNDRADKTLLPIGSIAVSARNQKLVVDMNNAAGRKAYALQWEENRSNLHQKSAKLGIPIIEITTESDVKKDLLVGLKTLSKRRRR